MPQAQFGTSLTAGGVSISKTVNRSGSGVIALQEDDVAAGKTVTAWVKTDANTAACNLPGGHGYTDGNFDVFWVVASVNYARYGVPGTISTNALSLDGGAGDDFPASATVGVVVCKQTSCGLLVDGDNTKAIAVCAESTSESSTSQASIMFVDAAGDTIAQMDLVANVPQIWDITGGSANPFTGDVITSVKLGNGSASEALTFKVCGVQDASP
jgi:hypothetical protein